jgi:hypothetical protein
MAFPKQIKKTIPLSPYRTLYPRRQELLDKINEHGTILPKSILHADLDRGFLDFVKETLKVSVEGKLIPLVDIIITTQNWAQFTETWKFQDLDKNAAPPFMTVVRHPETKYGSNPSTVYNIPNRREFYYASVPSYNGDRLSVDVYKIPQPIPVDIKYSLKIVCNRMRELNALNKTILQNFASRQAYAQIKGHYIPIIWNDVTDESVTEVEKRKYYIQTYEFTMLGFLIDEDEFEIKPAVERVIQLTEIETSLKKRKRNRIPENPSSYDVFVNFGSGDTVVSKDFYDNVNLNWISSENIEHFDVFINDHYYGQDIVKLQINHNDIVRFEITKTTPDIASKLFYTAIII